MARILLVEDEPGIASSLLRELQLELHSADLAEDGESAWTYLTQSCYELALIDVMLPKLTGVELCKRIRAHKLHVPVLLLTALDSSQDKVKGLDAGADDYLVKPFDLDELHARIRALLRRRGEPTSLLQWGEQICLEQHSKQILVLGKPIETTPREYQILELLLRYPGQYFSADDILSRIWGWETPNKNAVKTYISGLRAKFQKAGLATSIETLYGRGYRLPTNNTELTFSK